MMKILVITAIFVAVNCFAGQKFYKKVNADGSIEYFNKKPEKMMTSEVRVKTTTVHKNTDLYQRQLDEIADENHQKKVQHEQKKIEKEELKREHQKICNKVKRNLSSLKNLGRCGWRDPMTGESYEHLSDIKRGQLQQKYVQQKNEYCNFK